MTQFGTLGQNGVLTNVRTIQQSSLVACPFVIFHPGHYRADESCKCDDPAEQAMMIKEWGYKRSDFRKAGIRVAPLGPCPQCGIPRTGIIRHVCPNIAAPKGPGRKV